MVASIRSIAIGIGLQSQIFSANDYTRPSLAQAKKGKALILLHMVQAYVALADFPAVFFGEPISLEVVCTQI